MPKVVAFLILFAANAQTCIKYGAPATLTGTLLLKDEAGYNQFISLKPVRAICVEVDPKEGDDANDPYYRTRSNLREVQANVYGSDSASAALKDSLNRLIGHRVVIKGDMFPATTGSDRTSAVLRVQAVDPADPSGRQALIASRAEPKVKDVNVYDVTVNAAERLAIEAHESGSMTPLIPSDQYVTHWMTGLEVLYVACREGYKHTLISSTEKDGVDCFDGDGLCGLSAFPKKPVIIKLRCSKKP